MPTRRTSGPWTPLWAASALAIALAAPLAAPLAAQEDATGDATTAPAGEATPDQTPDQTGDQTADQTGAEQPADATADLAQEAADAVEQGAQSAGEAADALAEGADAAAETLGDAAGATGDAATGDATAEAAPAAPADPATVVATVNGTDITLAEVAAALATLPPQYQQLPPDVLLPSLVDQLVQQELLAQTVTDVPARVELQLANERRTLLAGEAAQAVAAAAATDEALQAAYDATYGAAEPQTEWNASHILVATEEEAQAVEARLAAGEAFEDVAREVSTDTGSGAQGGALGFFGPGVMIPEFEQAVDALEPGQVSAPVQSQFGWHVIRLNEERPVTPPTLDDVRPELEAQVQQEAVLARIGELEAQGAVTRADLATIPPASLADPALLGD